MLVAMFYKSESLNGLRRRRERIIWRPKEVATGEQGIPGFWKAAKFIPLWLVVFSSGARHWKTTGSQRKLLCGMHGSTPAQGTPCQQNTMQIKTEVHILVGFLFVVCVVVCLLVWGRGEGVRRERKKHII